MAYPPGPGDGSGVHDTAQPRSQEALIALDEVERGPRTTWPTPAAGWPRRWTGCAPPGSASSRSTGCWRERVTDGERSLGVTVHDGPAAPGAWQATAA